MCLTHLTTKREKPSSEITYLCKYEAAGPAKLPVYGNGEGMVRAWGRRGRGKACRVVRALRARDLWLWASGEGRRERELEGGVSEEGMRWGGHCLSIVVRDV